MHGDPRLRLAVLGVIVVSLFAALSTRLWYLQVLDATSFRVAAEANQVRLIYEEAPRGRILDRQGRVLVENRISDVLTISRVDAARDPKVLDRLAALLAIPRKEIDERVADTRFSPYKPVPLVEGIPEEKIVYLREHQADFPGVSNSQVAVRSYPHGTLGAHVLGYVGEINDRELEARRRSGYRLGDEIGKTGVERAYERMLRGQAGVTKLEVNSRGRVLQTLGHEEPVQGHDVQLTLDLDIQRLTEDSLLQGLEAARRAWDREQKKHFLAPAGAAVVMDPRDGSVLAMASYPTFEPAAFVNGIRTDVFRALQDPAGHFPLSNRAVSGQYAPGSTFKLFTAIAGLRNGLINPHSTIEDKGSLRVGNRTFRNAGRRAWGRVDLPRALAVSSDVYFYDIGWRFFLQRERFGDTPIQTVAREMGLGERLGFALDGEARGRVSDPATRKRLHDANPKAFPYGDWFGGDTVNLAIGQGETVATPLQLATAYSTFANGGSLYTPRVAARAIDVEGREVETVAPVRLRTITLPPEIHDPIAAGLRGAVTNEHGTARTAFGSMGTPVAGKTGTAQVVGKQDSAIFVGYAPANAPQYLVAVVMEESGFGGETAAPVARRVLGVIAGEPPGPITLGTGID